MTRLFILSLLQLLVGGQAYTTAEWETLQEAINVQFPNVPYSSLYFLEFGIQAFEDFNSAHFDLFSRNGFHTNGMTSPYFIRHLGFHHVSVDINRRESSRKLDCRKDITGAFWPQRFDIITNMRFSHHIGIGSAADEVMHAQYKFWKNAHDLGNIGSLYFHELVMSSPDGLESGVVHYSLEFVQELIRVCNYLPINEEQWFIKNTSLSRFVLPFSSHDMMISSSTTSIIIHFRKNHLKEFITFEDFKQLPGISPPIKDTICVPYFDNNQMRFIYFPKAADLETKTMETITKVCTHYPLPNVSTVDCEKYCLWYLALKLDPSLVDLEDPLYIYDHVSADIINNLILKV